MPTVNELSNAAQPSGKEMEKSLTESKNVKNPAPPITGIAIRNENLAASLALIPIIIDKEIVIPLLEIPWIIAKA